MARPLETLRWGPSSLVSAMAEFADVPPDVLLQQVQELTIELQRQRESLDTLLERYRSIAQALELHVNSVATRH